MTDKQIIIDNIDVGGCVNLRLEANTDETSYYNACSIGLWQRWYSNLEPSCIMSCNCKDNPNCYYKQLKRSEAKREAIFVTLTDSEKAYRRKEQECEELKEEKQSLIKDWGEKKNLAYEIACKNEKLRQTLTEIKEIAEINPINTCWTVLELCEKCDENKECDIQCPLFKFKLILQKISECEGNNEN